MSEIKLLDILMESKKMTQDIRDVLLAERERSHRSLESLLLEMEIVTEDELLDLFVRFRPCDTVSLSLYQNQICQLVTWIPYEVLERYVAVPIGCQDYTLTLAMADITDLHGLDTLRQYIPKQYQVIPVLAKKSEILEALQAVRPVTDIHSASQRHMGDQVISQFLYDILVKAIQKGASDIHFQLEKFLVRVQYRLDGILSTVRCFHESFWQAICVQLKVLAAMDIAETRLPQDGRFSCFVMGHRVDFRMACHPTIYGENVVLRILDQKRAILSLEKLGYSAHNLDLIYRILQKPEGLIVMTGPTGSGKTTSLYAMLSTLDREKLNIMTLEEPVEVHFSQIRQSEVREKGKFDFAAGMHSILRQDPDVILIGEIRDEKIAEMAIRAGMTGHLVFTTLHTTHGLGTLCRLRELKVPLSLLAGILSGIVAQRLIRLLCPDCKVPHLLSAQEAQAYHVWPQMQVFCGQGCSACSFSGYRGQKAIAEVIVMDRDLERLMMEEAAYPELHRFLVQKGFRELRSDGLDAVRRGETSLEELFRVMGRT